ncbi:MAG: DUF2220 family protein [Owenweeksia sp.]|nr:DUF2220 family protein [Owenweeksia sp.]
MLNLELGEHLPGSRLNKSWLNMLLQEGILTIQRIGRTKTRVSLVSTEMLEAFLKNRFGIADLEAFVKMKEEKEATGMQASEIASDTKLRHSRTFKGFLVNLPEPLEIKLKGKVSTLEPEPGTFTFIYDYEIFTVGPQVKVIGVENPESFRHIHRHLHLFPQGKKLFVSRYPQNLDLLRWLQSIPNPYLHFGDLDLAGIAIFENEYRKHLGNRASFIIPPNAKDLITQNGNRKLYNNQYQRYKTMQSNDPEIQHLINIIHQAKKGLEQEALVTHNPS